MLKRFSHNWTLKITALVLSVALWSHVRGEVNPWETATFKVRLHSEAPRSFVLQNERALPTNVMITVRAPRLTLRALKGGTPANPLSTSEEATPLSSRQLRASLDFSTPRTGLQKVPVKAETNLEDVEVIGAKPSEITVALDAAARREMTVETELDLSSQWQAENVRVSTPTVQVSGASRALENIETVTAKIETPVNKSGALDAEVPLQAFDDKGRAVENVQFEPKSVRVRAQIRERMDEKTVPVTARVEGAPARGYELKAAEVEPSRASIRGPRRVLRAIESITVNVDASGARAPISKRVRLNVPDGVELLSSRRVQVRVGVTRIETPVANVEKSSGPPSTPATGKSKPEASGTPATLPAPAPSAAKP